MDSWYCLLFNDESKVKTDLQAFGIELRLDVKDRITSDHPGFLQLIDYLERVVNVSGTAIGINGVIREKEGVNDPVLQFHEGERSFCEG